MIYRYQAPQQQTRTMYSTPGSSYPMHAYGMSGQAPMVAPLVAPVQERISASRTAYKLLYSILWTGAAAGAIYLGTKRHGGMKFGATTGAVLFPFLALPYQLAMKNHK